VEKQVAGAVSGVPIVLRLRQVVRFIDVRRRGPAVDKENQEDEGDLTHKLPARPIVNDRRVDHRIPTSRGDLISRRAATLGFSRPTDRWVDRKVIQDYRIRAIYPSRVRKSR